MKYAIAVFVVAIVAPAWAQQKTDVKVPPPKTNESTTGARPYAPYGAGAPYGWYERHRK